MAAGIECSRGASTRAGRRTRCKMVMPSPFLNWFLAMYRPSRPPLGRRKPVARAVYRPTRDISIYSGAPQQNWGVTLRDVTKLPAEPAYSSVAGDERIWNAVRGASFSGMTSPRCRGRVNRKHMDRATQLRPHYKVRPRHGKAAPASLPRAEPQSNDERQRALASAELPPASASTSASTSACATDCASASATASDAVTPRQRTAAIPGANPAGAASSSASATGTRARARACDTEATHARTDAGTTLAAKATVDATAPSSPVFVCAVTSPIDRATATAVVDIGASSIANMQCTVTAVPAPQPRSRPHPHPRAGRSITASHSANSAPCGATALHGSSALRPGPHSASIPSTRPAMSSAASPPTSPSTWPTENRFPETADLTQMSSPSTPRRVGPGTYSHETAQCIARALDVKLPSAAFRSQSPRGRTSAATDEVRRRAIGSRQELGNGSGHEEHMRLLTGARSMRIGKEARRNERGAGRKHGPHDLMGMGGVDVGTARELSEMQAAAVEGRFEGRGLCAGLLDLPTSMGVKEERTRRSWGHKDRGRFVSRTPRAALFPTTETPGPGMYENVSTATAFTNKGGERGDPFRSRCDMAALSSTRGRRRPRTAMGITRSTVCAASTTTARGHRRSAGGASDGQQQVHSLLGASSLRRQPHSVRPATSGHCSPRAAMIKQVAALEKYLGPRARRLMQ